MRYDIPVTKDHTSVKVSVRSWNARGSSIFAPNVTLDFDQDKVAEDVPEPPHSLETVWVPSF